MSWMKSCNKSGARWREYGPRFVGNTGREEDGEMDGPVGRAREAMEGQENQRYRPGGLAAVGGVSISPKQQTVCCNGG